ncbi:MAG: DUF5663 domain-containing protein [Candidatus Saccharimonadales bacterium]
MDFTAFVKELGVENLSEEEQKQFFVTVFSTLNKRVSLRLAQELTDEQKGQLEQVFANNNESAMEDMEKIFPDIRRIYQEEIDGLKEDMKALQ